MNNLCVAYGKSVQSKETGFIHTESKERISFLENLCFALGLFRTKQGENMREARDLVHRLLAFADPETGLLPRFIDQYPSSSRYSLLYLPLTHIKNEFIDIPEFPYEPSSELENLLAQEQIPSDIQWDPTFGCGDTFSLRGFEIEPTLLDMLLSHAAGLEIPRLLKPHRLHLFCSLIYPKKPFAPTYETKNVWGKGYTLSLQKNYPIDVPDEGPKSTECALYVSKHHELSLFVNGKKSTTFALGDTVEIRTLEKILSVTFSIKKGSGKLFGHISQGNRPSQLLDAQAYDWVISLRTLDRSRDFDLNVTIVSDR